MKTVLMTLFCSALVWAGSPQSLITAEMPERILEVAKGFGRASLEQDTEGDPKISGRMDGTKYTLHFYGCEGGVKCKDIQFSAAWSGTGLTVNKMNDWNRTKRFGKAYIDSEGDPVLEMPVNLQFGVSQQNLEDTFDWWMSILKVFKQEILNSGEE